MTGGAGFLGQMVVNALLAPSEIVLGGIAVPLTAVTVVDRVAPPASTDPRVQVLTGDLSALLASHAEVFQDADAVIHLASAVSGECEADLRLGLDANVYTGLRLAEVLAEASQRPILVFASSLAVYGGTDDTPLPKTITDDVRPTPQNSYGAQKLMLETLFADLHRRALIDLRALRLMTVSVRPGRPNQAASSFLSGIIREPLQGQPAVVPVDPDLAVALNSPAGAVAGLLHALSLDREAWGGPLAVNCPGLRITVGAMIDALEKVGGADAVARLTYAPDARISGIVSRWPSDFQSQRAEGLGFQAEPDFVEVIRQFQAGRLS